MMKKQPLSDWRNLLIILRRIQPQYPEGWMSTDELAARLGLSRSAIQERIARIKQNKELMKMCEEQGRIFDPKPGEVTGWGTYEQLAEEIGLSPAGVRARVKRLEKEYPRLKSLFAGQAPQEAREAVTRDLLLALYETVSSDLLPEDLRPVPASTKEQKRPPRPDKEPEESEEDTYF